ncbi:MAG TPA: hypothetical protein VMY69_09360 [Phycisphaerae bacterium]|nr:hypothetical protein [Phycisphaerae bacterium]
MPLRKKHVRRLVLALLFVGVLGPLLAMIFYGLWLRGGAYGGAIETALASRLRCKAAVHGARPTGRAAAAVRTVDLVWDTASGRLAIHLDDVTATSDAYGWHVTAACGRLALESSHPAAALTALNQRLVQIDEASPIASMTVHRLTLRLDLGACTAETDVRAAARTNAAAFHVHLFPPDEETADPIASLRFQPASPHGIFDGLKADVQRLPLRSSAPPTAEGAAETTGAQVCGLLDLAADWRWPETHPAAATVQFAVHTLDPAPWTAALPGGPIRGEGTLEGTYTQSPEGPAELAVNLAIERGSIHAATVRWLEGLPAHLNGLGAVLRNRIGFDRFAWRCRTVGDQGEFEGEADSYGRIPLLMTRLFGCDVPLLWASAKPFDAGRLGPPLRRALLEGAPTEAPPAPAAEK